MTRSALCVSEALVIATIATLVALLGGCGNASVRGAAPETASSASVAAAERRWDSTGPGTSGPAQAPPGLMSFPSDWPATAFVRGESRPDAQAVSPPLELTLHPGQELWIIQRPSAPDLVQQPAPRSDDCPGSATLMTRWRDPAVPDAAERDVPVPLAHTDVRASIAGAISSVTVTQQYHNPFAGKIEAVYVFPLPDDAAVNDFLMTIGTPPNIRTIRGVIRERDEAERLYTNARARGYRASIMTQERSNIFTQKVANIEPGERIDITTTYFHTLAYTGSAGESGCYEFVFPMVVGPRFNPPSSMNRAGSSGSGIGAIAHAEHGASGQGVEVQYLRPDTRTGHDIALAVDLAAGIAIEFLQSPSHQVHIDRDPADPSRARIRLAASDSIPNRDFVLRYRVAGEQLKGGFITHTDARGGFFQLMLIPPADLRYTRRGPVEMVFVIDCSGSMEGEPLRLARRAVITALDQLRPEDTFQIVRFADTADFMTRAPIAATPHNLRDGIDFVQRLRPGGGTMMLKGLEPALELRGDWNRARFVCLLSDGFLGNEPEVLGQLKRKLGDSRVFSVGIGSAPNRTLMNAMARIGHGAAAHVASDRDADDMMNLFITRISSAAMSDLRIDWGDLDVTDVYPRRLPDLFVGRPVVITGRYRNPTTRAGHDVRISGRLGDQRETLTYTFQAAGVRDAVPALPLVWARTRIQDLDEDLSWTWGASPGAGGEQGPNRDGIRRTALEFGLVSAYTSFIAVDAAQRTDGTYGTTVRTPVPVPQGVRYETTVQEQR